MRTCRVCGAMVDDKEWNCPECGATMISSGGSLSLKSEEPVKKKTGNRMGTTVSTGSGLTDILRGDDVDNGAEDDSVIMGSMPTSLSKNIIDEEEARKKAKANRQLISNIFKVVFIAACAFLVYLFVTKFVMKVKGAETCEDLVNIYMDAVNEGDAQLMKTIVPEFLNNRLDEAEFLIEDMEGAQFSSCVIKDKETITQAQMDILTDEIKLNTGKNANLNEGYYLEVEFTGTNKNGLEIKAVAEMEVYRVKNYWYLYVDTYENRAFSN